MLVEHVGARDLAGQIALAEELLERRQLREAETAFDLAERMGADADGCAAARWMAAMLGGDFEAAWRESDGIVRRGGIDPHRFWNGEDIRGKRVMVRCLHGFGDAIQFLRYLPRISELAAEVIVEVPPRMVSLAPLLMGMGRVVTWGDGAPREAPSWDVQVEVMELPYLFRTTMRELPLAVDYLRVPDAEVADAGRAMGEASGLRVGLVWAAGDWNPARSIPLPHLEPLVAARGAEFWSLQGGAAQGAASEWVRAGLLRDGAVCGDGLRVLAAVIANLDLVISVDTLAVHLTGAMGKPAWVLLQHAADWRWMTERLDSPWYPRARLFRQGREGDWDGVVQSAAMELGRLAGASGARPRAARS